MAVFHLQKTYWGGNRSDEMWPGRILAMVVNAGEFDKYLDFNSRLLWLMLLLSFESVEPLFKLLESFFWPI